MLRRYGFLIIIFNRLFMLFPVWALMKTILQVPGVKAKFPPGFGPLVHLSGAPSIRCLVPGSCWTVGNREKQPVIFTHKWQHAVRVNARCHKSATTLVKAQSSAWWHKCDTPLPKVCCRSLNFRSHYTTWTRLRSRVNIVITWFKLKSLLRASSVETEVQIVLIPRPPPRNMWVWGILSGLYMTAFLKCLK